MDCNTTNVVIEVLKEILVNVKENKEQKFTLSVREAALYSGMGHEKIRELIDKPNTDFPFFKVGSRVAINKILLNNWLDKISEGHRQI